MTADQSPAGANEPRPEQHLDKPVHVVAALLEDAHGRVLLTRRSDGGDFAGRWEFPGGKREPGETAEAALARELAEELGIDMASSSPLIRVPFAYLHKRIVLDVRRVADWQGTPRGLEQQALAWVPRDKLRRYAMPDADLPVVAALAMPPLYAVTPDVALEALADDLEGRIISRLRSGDSLVQLRLPSVPALEYRDLATRIATAAGADRSRLVLNSDVGLARILGAGVQLKASQLRELRRRPLPSEQLVMASCHDATALQHAAELGLDAAVLGSVNSTPSHPGSGGMGWEQFSLLRECCSLPIYAIGGMHPQDLAVARWHGAQGVAGIRAFW